MYTEKPTLFEYFLYIALLVGICLLVDTLMHPPVCPQWEYTQDGNGNCFAKDNCIVKASWTSVPCKK